MFRPFRALLVAIQDLVTAVVNLVDVLHVVIELQRRDGPSEARLEELERSRALWQSDMEALVATATGKYEAANNAEARTRTMKRHYERLADPFDEEGEEEPTAVPAGDVAGGEADGLLPLRVDVAPNHKALALRFKYGR